MTLLGRSLLARCSLALALTLSGAASCKPKRPAPAMLWPIPRWSLTDQDGRPFGADQLRGKVYVANFIFTRCPTSCPRLTRKMAALETRLRAHGARVQFVSISVDPTWDTPARLREYGARYHADWVRWHFVTGEHDQVLRAIDQGFRVSSGMPAQPQRPEEFDPIALAHSNHFAVVDAQGAMRGAYSVEEDTGVERIALDVEALLAP
jgi:protein SCO1/2